MCGPSAAQSSLSASQSNFFNQLQSSYGTEFAGQNAILSSLNSAFQPILAGGINQQGFSAGESAALNTGAINNSAAAYRNAAQATNEQLAGRGGGNAYLPSGTNAAIQAGLASNAAGNLANQENQITQANYAQGRQNFLSAAGALSNAANIYNPNAAAGQATQAGSSAFNSATQIYNQGNQWIGALGGALGGATNAFGGAIGGGLADSAMGSNTAFGNLFH